MRKILLVAVLTAAIVTPVADGSQHTVGRTGAVLSHYAHADVLPTCEPLLAQDGPQAWAELATMTVHLDRSICRQLSRPRSIEFPFALTVLLHEAAHIRYGDTQNLWPSERRAEKTARATLKDALVRFYGFTSRQAWAAWKQVIRNPY